LNLLPIEFSTLGNDPRLSNGCYSRKLKVVKSLWQDHGGEKNKELQGCDINPES